jgi:hypothetical protein
MQMVAISVYCRRAGRGHEPEQHVFVGQRGARLVQILQQPIDLPLQFIDAVTLDGKLALQLINEIGGRLQGAGATDLESQTIVRVFEEHRAS